jgi:protein TonB
MFLERDRLSMPLMLSLGFHALIGLGIFALGFVLEPTGRSDWGNKPGDAVVATLVSAAPIPIPRPETPTENIVANESKGVTQSAPMPKPVEKQEPVTKPLPIPKTVEKEVPKTVEKQVPKTVETQDGVTIPGHVIKPKPQPKSQAVPQKVITAANVPPRAMPTPQTAVPYGAGGAPSSFYSSFSAPNTSGGVSAQNENFGGKYAWYVDAVKRIVKDNWLLYEIDPHVVAPHRAYVDFDILRDGTPANIRLVQSSGVPTLDQSALRALHRVDKFGALPEGNRQTFEFWFDYPPK